jgi:hypothetical protein
MRYATLPSRSFGTLLLALLALCLLATPAAAGKKKEADNSQIGGLSKPAMPVTRQQQFLDNTLPSLSMEPPPAAAGSGAYTSGNDNALPAPAPLNHPTSIDSMRVHSLFE